MPTTENEKSYVVKTLSISKKEDESFEERYAELVKYARKNNLKKPTKSDLMGKMIKNFNLTPKQYFEN